MRCNRNGGCAMQNSRLLDGRMQQYGNQHPPTLHTKTHADEIGGNNFKYNYGIFNLVSTEQSIGQKNATNYTECCS